MVEVVVWVREGWRRDREVIGCGIVTCMCVCDGMGRDEEGREGKGRRERGRRRGIEKGVWNIWKARNEERN